MMGYDVTLFCIISLLGIRSNLPIEVVIGFRKTPKATQVEIPNFEFFL